MKVWRFYKIPGNGDIDHLSLEDKYPLYAFTTNKDLAKSFMESRDMKKFIKRASKMETEEYQKLAEHNRLCELKEHTFTTFRHKYTEKEERIGVSLAVTLNESCIIEDTPLMIQSEEFWDNLKPWGNPELFCKDLQDALISLDYWLNYQIYNGDTMIDPDESSYAAANWWVDELEQLISLFHELFAGDYECEEVGELQRKNFEL